MPAPKLVETLPTLFWITASVSVTLAAVPMLIPAPKLLWPPWTVRPLRLIVPLRMSNTRSLPLPLMIVLPVPLPTMFRLPLTSKSPDALVLSPLTSAIMLKVPLTAKAIVSVPALALAWLMAQRSDPGTRLPAASSVVVTV